MPSWSQSPWRYDDVSWGVTPCHGFCELLEAELLMDGIPLCIDCADLIVERQAAIHEHRGMAEMLPMMGS